MKLSTKKKITYLIAVNIKIESRKCGNREKEK